MASGFGSTSIGETSKLDFGSDAGSVFSLSPGARAGDSTVGEVPASLSASDFAESGGTSISGVDVANGDKLVYRHHTSPEFNIGKFRLRFKITTTDWQLNIVRHMKWWRKLPGWHAKETAFRDWYIALLEKVNLNPGTYGSAVGMLKCPEDVTGYREVRYPKMQRARQRVETELANPPKLELHIRREVLEELHSPAGVS